MTALVHENHPLESVEVCDAYLAAWLLLNGCTIVKCIWRPNAGPLGGLMVFTGSRVHEVVQEYFKHQARVEIWEFRGATNRITRCLHEARDQQRRTLSETEGKGGAL
jgi:hypothetical protein